MWQLKCVDTFLTKNKSFDGKTGEWKSENNFCVFGTLAGAVKIRYIPHQNIESPCAGLIEKYYFGMWEKWWGLGGMLVLFEIYISFCLVCASKWWRKWLYFKRGLLCTYQLAFSLFFTHKVFFSVVFRFFHFIQVLLFVTHIEEKIRRCVFFTIVLSTFFFRKFRTHFINKMIKSYLTFRKTKKFKKKFCSATSKRVKWRTDF